MDRSLRSGPKVVFQRAAKPLAAPDFADLGRVNFVRRCRTAWGSVTDPRVRSFLVVVLDELGDEVVEVPESEHDELVEALDFKDLDESLDMRVQIRSGSRERHRADSFVLDLVVEAAASRSVASSG